MTDDVAETVARIRDALKRRAAINVRIAQELVGTLMSAFETSQELCRTQNFAPLEMALMSSCRVALTNAEAYLHMAECEHGVSQ